MYRVQSILSSCFIRPFRAGATPPSREPGQLIKKRGREIILDRITVTSIRVSCASKNTTAALLPACLRFGAFVLPATSTTRFVSKKTDSTMSSNIPGAASAPSTSAAASSSVEEAKRILKRALVDSKGSTLAKDVVAAVEALSELNPTPDPGRAWSLHCGDWVSIGENIKDTTRTADGLECTLGRLTFDMFEPVEMPVLITSIDSTTGPRPEGASPTDACPYQIVSHFVARDGSGLRGISAVNGALAGHPFNPKRMVVHFSRGTIEPDDGQDLESWSQVIGLPAPTDKESEGLLYWVVAMAKGLMLELGLGFCGSADELDSHGELSNEVKRSWLAFIEVLFIDDDMLVTRYGNDAIAVVTRK